MSEEKQKRKERKREKERKTKKENITEHYIKTVKLYLISVEKITIKEVLVKA